MHISFFYACRREKRTVGLPLNRETQQQVVLLGLTLKIEVDALGVVTISRGCFERCGSNKKTPPLIAPTYSNLSSLFRSASRPAADNCSVRPHTVRRPRLALGDGAATRVSFFGGELITKGEEGANRSE